MILLNSTIKGKQEDSIHMKTITIFFFNVTLLIGRDSPLALPPVSNRRGCCTNNTPPHHVPPLLLSAFNWPAVLAPITREKQLSSQ